MPSIPVQGTDPWRSCGDDPAGAYVMLPVVGGVHGGYDDTVPGSWPRGQTLRRRCKYPWVILSRLSVSRRTTGRRAAGNPGTPPGCFRSTTDRWQCGRCPRSHYGCKRTRQSRSSRNRGRVFATPDVVVAHILQGKFTNASASGRPSGSTESSIQPEGSGKTGRT